MRRIRRTLGLVATVWLCCQASSMTLSAAIIGMLPFADAMMPCTCAHAAGDSAMCPMHHHQMSTAAAVPATPAPALPAAPVAAAPTPAPTAHAGHASHADTACHSASSGQRAAGRQAARTQSPAPPPAARQTAAPQTTSAQTAEAQPASSALICHMRSGDTASAVALVSVFGPLGLLAPPAVSLSAATVNSYRLPARGSAIERMLPPDPPPPRA